MTEREDSPERLRHTIYSEGVELVALLTSTEDHCVVPPEVAEHFGFSAGHVLRVSAGQELGHTMSPPHFDFYDYTLAKDWQVRSETIALLSQDHWKPQLPMVDGVRIIQVSPEGKLCSRTHYPQLVGDRVQDIARLAMREASNEWGAHEVSHTELEQMGALLKAAAEYIAAQRGLSLAEVSERATQPAIRALVGSVQNLFAGLKVDARLKDVAPYRATVITGDSFPKQAWPLAAQVGNLSSIAVIVGYESPDAAAEGALFDETPTTVRIGYPSRLGNHTLLEEVCLEHVGREGVWNALAGSDLAYSENPNRHELYPTLTNAQCQKWAAFINALTPL